MAKASDLIGRSGAGGFVPPAKKTIVPTQPDAEGTEGKHSKAAPPKDDKVAKAPKGPAGGGTAPTSIRPKV